MHGTIDGFNYGAVTPVVAYVMACLGSALGLRCTIRSLRTDTSWKPGWLGLGAAAIGSGIWTMHFVAMMGFHVAETPISYDLRRTVLSLVVAIVVVGVGVFIVGYRGATRAALLTAGLTTGLGVAGMHYLGMAGMRMNGRLEYSPVAVALSILIAVVAATAALWAAVSVKGFLPSLGASLVMGVAVTGMHYTGMSGLSVRLHESHGAQALGGASAVSIMLPLMVGPLAFLLLAAVVVMFDPILVLGEGEWTAPAAPQAPKAPADDWPEGFGAAYPGTTAHQSAYQGPAAHQGAPVHQAAAAPQGAAVHQAAAAHPAGPAPYPAGAAGSPTAYDRFGGPAQPQPPHQQPGSARPSF
ncbi:MHYT domain-containing protein [Streptomyces californicus]|nr:MHYT domain-containing protein [Streptomyces californicus]MDW4916588.1 MHYT domain-containing protein [Streptomyces californicus]